MPRVTRAADHLSVDELDQRIKQATHHWHRLAWQVILIAHEDPRPAAVIARQFHVSKDFVHKVIARYNRDGPDAIQPPPPVAARHCYLSRAEEEQFLAPFFDRARRGDIITAREIQRAYEVQVGHAVAESTISRLLKRHQWRKLVPRPRHPRSDPEEQDAWKASFAGLVAAAVATRAPDDTREVVVMAQDEGLLAAMQQHGWPVTFSLGVATFLPPLDDVDALVRQADNLMYQVKRQGKNAIATLISTED